MATSTELVNTSVACTQTLLSEMHNTSIHSSQHNKHDLINISPRN